VRAVRAVAACWPSDARNEASASGVRPATTCCNCGSAAQVARPSRSCVRTSAAAAPLWGGGGTGSSGTTALAGGAGTGFTPSSGTTWASHVARGPARRRTTWSRSGRRRPRSSSAGSSGAGSCIPTWSQRWSHSPNTMSCSPPTMRARRRAHSAVHGGRPSGGASGSGRCGGAAAMAPARRATTTAAARSSSATAGSASPGQRSHPSAAAGSGCRSAPSTAVVTSPLHSVAALVARSPVTGPPPWRCRGPHRPMR
jgi:hypothetical protein